MGFMLKVPSEDLPHITKSQQESKQMTDIKYSGIGLQSYGLLNTEAFHFLLKNNPKLRLVTASYDDTTEDEIFTKSCARRLRPSWA